MVVVAFFTLTISSQGAAPRFFPDDPLLLDDDRAFDAGQAKSIEGSNAYDFAEHTFLERGERRDLKAVNVNSVDELPDSSWFTNRIGRRALSIAELVRGPNTSDTVDVGGWPVVEGKGRGVTPGYRVVDPTGHLYQIKFDPPDNPEIGSAAEMIGAAIYHALGYNIVQSYIVDVDPAKIVIAPTATAVDMDGRTRPMDRSDLDKLLARAARSPNGTYRATLSRFADGKPLGFFKYYGTRPDDPNDIHAHEHRRELRANRVFAAWLNHDDSRGLNSLDMLEGPVGRQYIKHYMFDFGSIMGSGSTMAQVPRAGNEYILEWAPALKTLATLGLYVRPWIQVNYWEGAKSVGRFEGDFFEPLAWRPEYPNPAFDNLRSDDAFWAARLIAKFRDEDIRAIVAKAKYSEAGAADHIAATLIKRRDKVLREWLTEINPLADPRLSSDGTLTFENSAVDARATTAPSAYDVVWSRFDNATNASSGVSQETRVTEPRATAPRGTLEGSQFVTASVRTTHSDYPHWKTPVTFTFRRTDNGWQTVGVDRNASLSVKRPKQANK